MRRTLTRRLLSILKIQADEIQQVLLVCLFALLPSVGGAIGSPGIEALFFARFGVQFLPYMYIALGAITMVSTLTLTAVLSRIPKSRLFRLLPLVMAGLLVIARLLVAMDLTAFYPVLWLGMYLFWTLQALLIWGVAGMIFNTRQAKRVFPLFAASAIAGNALGGLLTGPLVTWLGTENLLLIWSSMLVFAFLLAVQVTRAHDPPQIRSYRPEPGIRATLQGGGKSVANSPMLRWLSVTMLLLAILLYGLAFPFSKAVAMQFPSEDALAGFLGVFQGVTTAFALLTSLVFANRLFARVGFLGTLLIFAFIYVLGFGSMVLFASFAGLVIFRFAQQAWMMGVADTAYQATFNIVPPEQREPARMFVDGIPKQVGVALSGVFLLTLQPVLSESLQFATLAAVASMCALAVWRAQRAFTSSLAVVLDKGQMHIFQGEHASFAEFAHDAHAFDVLASGLESDQVAVRQTVVEILSRLDSRQARSKLERTLKDPADHIRTLGLQALLRSSTGSEKEAYILQALRDPSPAVRCEGLRAITGELIENQDVQEQLEGLLTDPQAEVRSLAAAQTLKFNGHPNARDVLSEMARSEDPQLRVHAMTASQIWGQQQAYELVAQGLQDQSPLVRSRAIESMASIDPERCLEPIKAALGDPERLVRNSAAKALAAVGSRGVPHALEALADPELEAGALIALEQLSPAGSRDALSDYVRMRVDASQQLESYCQQLLVTGDDPPRLQLLHDSLRDRARTNTLRSLRAFQLISNKQQVGLAIAGLQSKDDDQQANALELLDALAESHLIQPALEIWETDHPVVDPIAREGLKRRRSEAILQLLESEDNWLRACAAFAAQIMSRAEVQARLGDLSNSDPEALVRETAASEPLTEDAMESISTLPIMERILFLREVPLFSELSPEELKQVASIAGEHIFKDGETFADEGELGDEMFIIVSGTVRVLKGSDQKEIAQRRPGEFVGEMSILTQEPRMASLVAEGDVFALCLEQSNFEQMLLEKPEIGLSVMRSLIQRLKSSRGELPGGETPA